MISALACKLFPQWMAGEPKQSSSKETLHVDFYAREATTDDLDEMLELFFVIFAEPQFNDKSKGFDLLDRMQMRYRKDSAKHEREFWGRDKNRRFAVVIRERKTDKLVGTAWLISDLDSDPEDDVGEVNKIYLLPECRGKGLGFWLMRRLMHEARRLGFRRLSLITGRELSQAVSLYCKLGFVPATQGRYANSPNSIAMVFEFKKSKGEGEQ